MLTITIYIYYQRVPQVSITYPLRPYLIILSFTLYTLNIPLLILPLFCLYLYHTPLYTYTGNMTHDLKTPMAGIISGLETIESSLQIAYDMISTPESTNILLCRENIASGLSVVQNVKSINNFMLSTINRYIYCIVCIVI